MKSANLINHPDKGYNGSPCLGTNNAMLAKVNGINDVYLGCPIGTIVMWAGQENAILSESGWCLCNGDTIVIEPGTQSNYDIELTGDYPGYYKLTSSHSKYKELAKLILGTYRTTDDGTKYTGIKLPDFRRSFPLGAETSIAPTDGIGQKYWDSQDGPIPYSTDLGKKGGQDTHTLNEKELNHSHKTHHLSEFEGSQTSNWYTSAYYPSGGQLEGITDNEVIQGQVTIGQDTYDYSPISHNITPPFLAINFIIKYK